jgi:hypothetical protein
MMADSNNNNGSEGEGNTKTDSNLPILFANGYPISLDKMTSEQLERFIPFLVNCSRKTYYENDDATKPKWWPSDIEFKMPLEKPKIFKRVSFQKKKYTALQCFLLIAELARNFVENRQGML